MAHNTSIALCNSAPDHCISLALCAVDLVEGQPPEWIMLVPAGDAITTLDGRKFSNANPQAIVDTFNADPRDVPLDWNHASELKARKGEDAPAAAWIVAMEVRDGAVWGKAEWTARGEASVIARESRYISPAFNVLKNKAKQIVEIISAGLVNRPAFDMPAIARADTPPTEIAMDPRLLKLLGLTAESTPEEITAAITKLEAIPGQVQEVQTKLDSTAEELANARAAHPSLDSYVPRADYDVVMARAKTAEDKVATAAAEAHTALVEVEITAALKAAKITPATKDFYVDTCSTPEGLEKFRKFVTGTAPVLPSDPVVPPTPPGGGTAVVLTADEKKIAKLGGMTDEQFLAGRE